MAMPKPPTLDSEWASWRDDVLGKRGEPPENILRLMEECFYAGATASLFLLGAHKVSVPVIMKQLIDAVGRFTSRLKEGKEGADEPSS